MRTIFRSDFRISSFSLSIRLAAVAVFLAASHAADASTDSLTIIVSGAYRGRAAGCECPGGSRGSLARRSTLMNRQFTGETPLVLDCGRFLDLDPVQGREISWCTLTGLSRLGLKAALVSTRDLYYGENFLREISDSSGIDLLSANIVSGASGERLFDTWKVLSSDMNSIAVAGLTRHQEGMRIPGIGAWITISPDSVLGDLRASTPREADLYILLTDLNTEELTHLLPELPAFDFIFTSHRATSSAKPVQIRDTVLIKPTPNGGAVDGIVVWKNNLKLDYCFFSHQLSDRIPKESATDDWLNNCLQSRFVEDNK